ncbi:arabinogalactan endo-1,4-beta-galactosidase [Nibribacter ruber]|uniref:Arabinogalactan endo-beta-1,4-galactanase n=1 Tax=Nibribacter ruber TaxID=2698458 RepID=A0A6P1P2B7_9BACT|nr:glycosyl hydrolase 53 family protein [Nibribacter ruber]QHL88538.1 arabinogalactan endo-1,4-beta-galactosidase [Nibribacter ruber]
MTVNRYLKTTVVWAVGVLGLASCSKEDAPAPAPVVKPASDFYFGADLSYVNQILDQGGVYQDKGQTQSPYKIFKDHGATLARFRLWHTPTWTKDVYGAEGTQLYSDLADVEKGMRLAKAQGMSVLLDFHYSDTWADPGKQTVPAAWSGIKDPQVLQDSVYQYTKKTLTYLNSKGLMPELVQIGNETNGGMLYTEAPAGFPMASMNQLSNLRQVINSGIKAVRDVSAGSSIKSKVILHVANPQHVEYWFSQVAGVGGVSDFDIIGFSYYPLWHTTVPLTQVSDNIAAWRKKFNKDVILLETAYPWTTNWNDNYANQLGGQPALSGYPYTPTGQLNFMKALTKEVKDGGGKGIVYWEPAWISSNMKDLWGTGSSWENVALFDFMGNPVIGMDYMTATYK